MPFVRVIAVPSDTATVTDVRQVDAVPRIGDTLDVRGAPMTVRSVIAAEPGGSVAAFVYVTPSRRDETEGESDTPR